MSMKNLDFELKLFAININFEVGECFLKRYFNEPVGNGTMNPCSLFSEFGQKTITRFLQTQLLDFYEKLASNPLLQLRIDDNFFKETVHEIIEKSNWFVEGPTTFYETCAKIIIFGIFAMGNDYYPADLIKNSVLTVSKEAYEACILDSIYDIARKNAQSIIFTLFKMLKLDLNDVASPIEREIGWSEIDFSDDLIANINRIYPGILLSYRYNPSLMPMDAMKFKDLVSKTIERFFNCKKSMSRDHNDNYLLLAARIGLISFYSIEASFLRGIQYGIDSIVKLVVLESRHYCIRGFTFNYFAKEKSTK